MNNGMAQKSWVRSCVSIWFLAFLFLSTFQAISSHASNHVDSLGVGVMFGEPTGLNLKYWNSASTALNFGLAYSFDDYFVILGDYLWHFPNAFRSVGSRGSKFFLSPYLGIGAVFWFYSNNRHLHSASLGVRIPFGIEFQPHYPPLGIFLEIAPGVGIAPTVDGFLQGDIGIRYYF